VKTRKHHNNKGCRRIKTGWCEWSLKRIAERILTKEESCIQEEQKKET